MDKYIPWIISALSLFLAYLTFRKNSRKDIVTEAHEQAGLRDAVNRCNIKLDQVCNTTNETRSDIKAMNNTIHAFELELTKVKSDVATALDRIQRLEKKFID